MHQWNWMGVEDWQVEGLDLSWFDRLSAGYASGQLIARSTGGGFSRKGPVDQTAAAAKLMKYHPKWINEKLLSAA